MISLDCSVRKTAWEHRALDILGERMWEMEQKWDAREYISKGKNLTSYFPLKCKNNQEWFGFSKT